MKPTYTAICFFPTIQSKRPHKYKNCSTPARLCIYMKRKGAEYINFYCSQTQEYKFRLYCNPQYDKKPLHDNTGNLLAERFADVQKKINSRNQ